MREDRPTAALAGFVLLGWVLACGGSPPSSTPKPSSPPTAPATQAATPAVLPAAVSAREYGDKWPLTIPGGTLRCEKAAEGRLFVTIDTGNGLIYALNGSARQFATGVKDGRDITKRQGSAHTGPTAEVSETTRKRAFADIVRCEDGGSESEVCWARSAKQHKLTAEEITRIRYEGLNKSWPPLDPPPPMSVQPLIERGLKLCAQ